MPEVDGEFSSYRSARSSFCILHNCHELSVQKSASLFAPIPIVLRLSAESEVLIAVLRFEAWREFGWQIYVMHARVNLCREPHATSVRGKCSVVQC